MVAARGALDIEFATGHDSVTGPTATITLVELLADEIRKRDWSN